MGQTPYKSFLRNYYLAGSLYDCIFAYAMYTVLFQLRGLSVLQISMLLAIWSVFAIAFEIPTGGLADSWSRRRMLIIAPLVKALCFLTWLFADGHFYMYVLGFGFWSLGSSFVSGTSEALLYDTLVHFGKSEEYERVLGRMHFYYNIALGVACISGGFMAALNLNLPLIASIIPLILSSIFFSRIREVPKAGSTDETHYLQHIKAAMGEMRTNRTLLYIGIYLWGIYTVFGTLEEYDQLYYKLVGLPIAAFGVVGFIVSMLVAWSSSHAYRLRGSRWVFFAFPAAGGCLLLLVGRFHSMPMLALLCLS